ncbi:hypothetical protein OSB04_008127 [Centaurea solstitialis]|uniref:glyceraldehyde-3-phosphate dehydrogenase (NADP(+)) (phosphorylating) n=1 Tax=Centaurea solstitialis TaxID=347529 RepID=A0AA38WJ69_9ASTR|nr:hypothetical protein OSB04_008127 [Centaurea solstitialis]
MASAAFSMANSSLQVNGKGFSEFTGLRGSSASLPFGRKGGSDDLVSMVAFQTSFVGVSKVSKGVVAEAKLKVAINGFGRIGRNFLRCWHGRKDSPLDVIAINDTGGVKQASHLLKYDSTLGIFDAVVAPSGDNAISVDGKIIKVVSDRNPSNLPWGEMGIDLVIEGTGVFVDREGAGKHIEAGAKKVLITAPGKGDIPTYVVGVNADLYTHAENIISNASCTTNCLAPFVKVIDQKFGIIKGTMTTTHSYTGDQRLLDASHRDLRRARAAALNIVPTSTGAAKAVALVLPSLKGKLNGIALRVPTPNVSVVDLVVQVSKKTFAEEVNAAFREAADNELKGILSVCDEPLVSVDFRCSDVSSTVDSSLTMVMGDDMVKVIAWYDNEWGYSQRVVDLADIVANNWNIFLISHLHRRLLLHRMRRRLPPLPPLPLASSSTVCTAAAFHSSTISIAAIGFLLHCRLPPPLSAPLLPVSSFTVGTVSAGFLHEFQETSIRGTTHGRSENRPENASLRSSAPAGRGATAVANGTAVAELDDDSTVLLSPLGFFFVFFAVAPPPTPAHVFRRSAHVFRRSEQEFVGVHTCFAEVRRSLSECTRVSPKYDGVRHTCFAGVSGSSSECRRVSPK